MNKNRVDFVNHTCTATTLHLKFSKLVEFESLVTSSFLTQIRFSILLGFGRMLHLRLEAKNLAITKLLRLNRSDVKDIPHHGQR